MILLIKINRKLINKEGVRFAGYRIPHPLCYYIELKVQSDDLHRTPRQTVITACNELQIEFSNIKQLFSQKYNSFNR